ncbi:LEA type 2 family protein [Moritella dasanensis]|uniref:LEA type 2 family protein n=1 Tax=Moritella dasanensis TaxID=428031 RepID=UPI00035D1FBD|nr:LEA type 2 family protein [Moritella dasanensis]
MSTWKSLVMVCVLVLSGCTNIQNLRDLDVSLIKIESIPSSGLSPRFNVHLLVSNPNAQDLDIEGLSLQLNVADKKVLSGVSNQLPTLKAYSETPIEVQTNVNLFYIFKVLTSLNQQSGEGIKYQLKTTIDPQGFIPLNVTKEGILDEDILQGLSTIAK